MTKTHNDCAGKLVDLIPPLMQEIRHSMRGGRGKGLSVPQFRVLAMIYHHPGTSLTQVAAHVGLGSPAMSVMVDDLVRQRLLTRVGAVGDRRRTVLDLTSAGRKVLHQAWKNTRRMLAAKLVQLPAEQISQIGVAIGALQTIFGNKKSTSPVDLRDHAS